MSGPPATPPGALPLYQGLGRCDGQPQRLPLAQPHPGLYFDKFVDAWSMPRRGPVRRQMGGAKDFLTAVVGEYEKAKPRITALLAAHWRRHEQLVRAHDGAVLEAATGWRLVLGLGSGHPLETGFTWHPTLGVPYLAGSGVKGLIRAWAGPEAAGGWGQAAWEQAKRLFGDTDALGAGSLVLFDALPAEPPKLEIDVLNPHYPDYYGRGAAPGDYQSPVPVYFLAVAPGQRFRFALAPRPGADPEAAAADRSAGAELLAAALQTVGAGGKTAVGYGVFGPVRAVPAAGGDAKR